MTKAQRNSRGTASRTRTKRRVRTCPKCGEENLREGRASPTKSGKVRWECRKYIGTEDGRSKERYCYSTTNPDAPYQDQNGNRKEADKNPQFRKPLSGIKRFIITAAQNATPLHMGFFESLKQYASHNDAELVIIPIRYKNPTSRFTLSQQNAEVWLEELGEVEASKYLYNQRKKLNENLALLGDVKTQPTAVNPLTGFESVTAGESGILGHTKLQMQVIPVPAGRYPKIMTTTGACTVKNYTDSKAGKVGEFHHATAAVVVEIVGKKFFLRHVNATQDGSFIDLTKLYTPDGVKDAPRPLALVFGDTHRAFIDKKVEAATYGEGGMVDLLDPEHLVFHDLHDGYARNPHHRQDPFSEIAKRSADMHRVEKEIRDDVAWLRKVVGKRKGVIVPSNHDNFFARWILDTDWRRDPDNASFYLETAKVMVDSVRMTESGATRVDPFTYWVDRLKDNAPIRCLRRDESFMLGGVELSLHGDMGPNGTRGSRKNLRRIGVKSIIGHSHTPGIEEGCYQAGTSTPLKLEYNVGPSSWLQAHVILYGNGKRAILPIIDGHWCFYASTKV